MARRQIILVANSSWNIYNFRTELIQHLNNVGYDISILCGRDTYTDQIKECFPGSVYILRWMRQGSKNIVFDLLLFFELCRYYLKLKPQLVLQYTIKPNLYGSLAAQLLNIPAISNLTGLGFAYNSKSVFKSLFINFYRGVLASNKFVIFHNADDLEFFTASKAVFKNKARVIPGSGVNANHFTPVNRNDDPKRFRCVFAARLLKEKGIYEFIEACRSIKAHSNEIEFIVAGPLLKDHHDSILKQELENWIQQSLIEYKGHAQDIRAVLSLADVYVLPSYREGMPRTLLEAMSMEIPVVVTDVPGCSQAVVHGINGLVVPAGDVRALVHSINRMKNMDEESRKNIGKEGRSIILKRYTIEYISKEYQLLLDLTLR